MNKKLVLPLAAAFCLAVAFLAHKTQTAKTPNYSRVFFEYPNGQHRTVEDGLGAAIEKLYNFNKLDRWLNISAQGMGGRVDSYTYSDVQIKKGLLKTSKEIPATELAEMTGFDSELIEYDESAGVYLVPTLTPRQVGNLIHHIFTKHLNVKPQTGERDYQFGAEWLSKPEP